MNVNNRLFSVLCLDKSCFYSLMGCCSRLDSRHSHYAHNRIETKEFPDQFRFSAFCYIIVFYIQTCGCNKQHVDVKLLPYLPIVLYLLVNILKEISSIVVLLRIFRSTYSSTMRYMNRYRQSLPISLELRYAAMRKEVGEGRIS